MDNVLLILVTLLGLVMGSFLNVCIYRIPKGISLLTPPSHCPSCDTVLTWWQNIPVISYLLLRRRCHACGEPISIRYPLIELLTGSLAALAFLKYGLTLQFATYTIFIIYLIAIALMDYDHFMIYDVVTYSGIILGVILSIIPWNTFVFFHAILGLIIGVSSLFLIRILGNKLFQKDTMGLGDIKLAGLIGVFLGWKLMLLSFFMSAVLIIIVHLIQSAIKRKAVSDQYPLGFYFAISAILCVFIGNEILQIYTNYYLSV